MLPYFVKQDFDDVMTEMHLAGFPLKDSWFAPHFEFRFPKVGDFATRGVDIELRHALEPLARDGRGGRCWRRRALC